MHLISLSSHVLPRPALKESLLLITAWGAAADPASHHPLCAHSPWNSRDPLCAHSLWGCKDHPVCSLSLLLQVTPLLHQDHWRFHPRQEGQGVCLTQRSDRQLSLSDDHFLTLLGQERSLSHQEGHTGKHHPKSAYTKTRGGGGGGRVAECKTEHGVLMGGTSHPTPTGSDISQDCKELQRPPV